MDDRRRPRQVAYDDDWWYTDIRSGSVYGVDAEPPDGGPYVLVPNGAGGYREHRADARPKGRLGF